MRTILAFAIGVVVGAGGLWYLGTNQGRARVDATSARVETTARSVHDGLDDKIREWRLGPQEVREELARTGQVVRQKATRAGHAIADTAADTRISGIVKGKILLNHDLASHDLNVTTTGGVVTLSGTAATAQDVSRALALAMDTEGVRQVVSKIQLAPARK
jgi:osmotically-inducible protein OsmY